MRRSKGDDPILAQFFLWVLGLVWVPLIWESDLWELHLLGWVALTWFWWPSWLQVARRAFKQTARPLHAPEETQPPSARVGLRSRLRAGLRVQPGAHVP